MTITKICGGYLISDIVNGYLLHRTYVGYTKKESVKLFKSLIKQNKTA